jgi:transposase
LPILGRAFQKEIAHQRRKPSSNLGKVGFVEIYHLVSAGAHESVNAGESRFPVRNNETALSQITYCLSPPGLRSKVERHSEEAEKAVREIRRATRRQYSAEEKVRIVIAGLRGEDGIAELCRKEGINQNLYYRWSKDFLEAGKKRLAGDTAREATSDEVKGLRAETHQLKELLAELMMENRLLKKSVLGDGESDI